MAHPTSFRSVLSATLLLLAAVAGSGCCVIDGACLEAAGADEATSREFEDGGAASATPGCAENAITERGDEICATCDFAAEPMCGVPVFASCETRQNSQGATCQLCIATDGSVLYDDCFANAAPEADAAFCETTPGRTADESCNTCFDSLGNAQSTSCAPVVDRCDDFVADDGRSCSRCVRDDSVVFTVCDTVDIDPRSCRAYGDATGRCVDCFGDGGALLSHACAPSSGARVCEERVQPEGLICTVCFNESGLVVEQSCDGGVPQIARCEQLNFSEQSCVVCVDAKDDVVVVDCVADVCEGAAVTAQCRADADCAPDQACFDGICVARSNDLVPPEPTDPVESCSAPACSMGVNADGAICRTCPTSTGTTETLCLTSAPLTCEVLPEEALPTAPSDAVDGGEAARPAPAPQGRLCTLCRDSDGLEVYRDCEGNGAVPPPYCVDVVDADAGTCSACFDAVTDAPVYTSCAEQSCFDRTTRTLADRNGVPLNVGADTAVVDCEQCSVTGGTDTSCRLQQTCSADLFTDAVGACSGEATVSLRPNRCDNPWEPWRVGVDRDDDLTALLAYALDDHRLSIQAATSRVSGIVACAANDCSCDRADVIELVVAAGDVDATRAAFAPFVIP